MDTATCQMRGKENHRKQVLGNQIWASHTLEHGDRVIIVGARHKA